MDDFVTDAFIEKSTDADVIRAMTAMERIIARMRRSSKYPVQSSKAKSRTK